MTRTQGSRPSFPYSLAVLLLVAVWVRPAAAAPPGSGSLRAWEVEDYVSEFNPSVWTVKGALKDAVLQTANPNPAMFYSDFDAANRVLRVSVNGGGDDDYLGFALGFQPGDSMNPSADYLLIDWKRTDQEFTWGCGGELVAKRGLAVSRVFGVPSDGEFWGHVNVDEACSDVDNGLQELQRGFAFGSAGWEVNRTYVFEFRFTESSLRVSVDGTPELDITGNFEDGRFAFYNFAVQDALYAVDAGDINLCSCRDIAEDYPGTPDGLYMLYGGGHPFEAYCDDMSGDPRDYLELSQVGNGSNFSQYTAGGASPGTNVVTEYERLRLDPSTHLVNIGDQRFTTSTGSLLHGGTPVTSMPYGVAEDCKGSFSSTGLGNIDLQGGPFFVVDEFEIGGNAPGGGAVFSSGNQVVDLEGGGFCGWITASPVAFNPHQGQAGFLLDLGLCTTELPGDDIDQDCDGREPCGCHTFPELYPSCVRNWAADLVNQGLINEVQMKCIVDTAARSECATDPNAQPPGYAKCFSDCR